MTTASLIILLAQMCIAEVGFKNDTSECELMISINRMNARNWGDSLARQTRLYNSLFSKSARALRQQRARPWILNLNDSEKPNSWRNKDGNWHDVHRPRWLKTVAVVIALVNGRRVKMFSCPNARHYGGKGENPGPRWRPVKCLNNQKQVYWERIPRKGK